MSIGGVEIGKLDRRVVIRSLSTALDAAGQEVQTPTDVATVWMAIKPQPGGERFDARQVIGKAVVTFVARYRSDINVEHVLFYEGATWDIHDIREIDRRRGIEIDASARSES